MRGAANAGLPRVIIMPVLTMDELERLLLPYGDLTTEALRIGAVGCHVTFAARAMM